MTYLRHLWGFVIFRALVLNICVSKNKSINIENID